jgi:hypothetical protein
MKVVVGAAASQTPMIATQMRYAAVNPYWNVPPDLVATLIAPKVMAQGRSYLVDRRYEVLSDWTEAATPLEPEAVDWSAVASGRQELRVRQLPGGANSMGRIKFLMPNEHGIYLHDTPNRALFAQDDRWVSNGCVRLEDADALARFVFGDMPQGRDPDREDRVDLDKPVPVYMTYLTAAATSDGVQFRRDPYGRDAAVLAAMERSLGPVPILAAADLPPDPLAPGAKGEAARDSLAPSDSTKAARKAEVRATTPAKAVASAKAVEAPARKSPKADVATGATPAKQAANAKAKVATKLVKRPVDASIAAAPSKAASKTQAKTATPAKASVKASPAKTSGRKRD